MAGLVFVLTGGQTDLARGLTREGLEVSDLFADVVDRAVEAADVRVDEIDASHIGNAFNQPVSGQGQLDAMPATVRSELCDIPAGRHRSGVCVGQSRGNGRDGRDRGRPLRRVDDLREVCHLHHRNMSPSLADGSGLLLLAGEDAAPRIGLNPRARIVGGVTTGAHPVTMLTAGQHAILPMEWSTTASADARRGVAAVSGSAELGT